MKGIREAAMGTQEDEIETYEPQEPYYSNESNWNKWPKKQPSLYEKDEFNPTAEEIARDEKELESYSTIKPQGQIDITIGVKYTELKGDDYSVDWETKSKIEATEIAYDRLKKLFNKDFESKYQAIYTMEEDYDCINVMIKLTPIK